MRKYFQLLSISWQDGFVYRTSVFLWRFRNFLAAVLSLTVWSLLLSNGNSVGSYDQSSAITYVFVISLLQSVVLSTSLHGMSEFIYSGGLSIVLVRPLNVFAYFATQEVADKLKNFLFLLAESTLLWWLFQPTLVLPDTPMLALFLVWTAGAIYLNGLLLMLLGMIGFWSPETWAPRFLFFILLDVTAGKLFPLDILPKIIQQVLFLTPLPYLSFMQTQLFLGKLDATSLWQHTVIFVSWMLVGTVLVRIIWRRGMRQYAGAGQ